MTDVLDNLDFYTSGLRITIGLTVLAYLGAITLGTVLAAMRVSPVRPARAASATYVEMVRNIPLPVLFALFFFGLPKVGVTYSAFVSAVIVLALYTAAFAAEIVRSGINAVGVGQGEASRAIGLTFPQTLRHVVLPQALRSVVQPLGTLLIALTKNTSIAATIAVGELAYNADRLNTSTANPLPVFLGAAVAYLILTLPTGYVVGVIERRVAITR